MAEFRRFISMKLNQIKPAVIFNLPDCRKPFIDKNAHRLYRRRNGSNDLTCLLGCNSPRAVSKDKPKHVSTEFDSAGCIFVICYAADFYCNVTHFACLRRLPVLLSLLPDHCSASRQSQPEQHECPFFLETGHPFHFRNRFR